jgi:23S rRNA (uracil1939-C5)-methyltransferase
MGAVSERCGGTIPDHDGTVATTAGTAVDDGGARLPRRGEELDVEVSALAYGGAGVARLGRGGFVLFVRGGFPGDRVRVRVTRRRRSYAEAEVVELLEPSGDRVATAVDHPGAPWLALRYETQLHWKQLQVRDALERLGGFRSPPLEPIVPARERTRYRNKLEYSFGVGSDGRVVLGFHRRGRFDLVTPIEQDILASERVDQVRNAVRDWCLAVGLSAYDRRSREGLLRNLVVREGRRTGDLSVRLVTAPGALDAAALAAALPATGVVWTRTDALAEVTSGGESELVAGREWIEEELCGLRFRISPDAFFQTNTEMAEELYRLALAYADLDGTETVLDLFCGTGTIGLVMALEARAVLGLELNPRAVADAIANARLNAIDNATFYCGDVADALPELCERAPTPPAVAVVDPPRAGLSKRMLEHLLSARPERIVYVSCNPTTLAPNARTIVAAGYELERVRPVDMFPQTPHIECVAAFKRTVDGPSAR